MISKMNLNNNLKNKKGFTLVEILIVMTIIGGLIALLAPNIFDNLNKSRVRETRIIMGQISQALNMYQSDCQKFPSSLEFLMKQDPDCASWGPTPYMKKPPKDAWKNDFAYTGTESEFTLKSYGSDKKEGGDAFAKDIDFEDAQ